MTKHLKIIFIAMPIIFLALLAATLAFLHNNLPEVTVRIAGYDPRDLLSGHYIAYTIDWQNTDCTQFENNQCPKNHFYQHGINGLWGNNHRFYIPEKNARQLDNMFRQQNQNNDVFEVVYGYRKGFRPIAKKLLINGKDWRQAISEIPAKQ